MDCFGNLILYQILIHFLLFKYQRYIFLIETIMLTTTYTDVWHIAWIYMICTLISIYKN